MKIIDFRTYPRLSHYEFFKSYAYPYMGMTANVDVTNLYNAAKDMGGSPFLAFLWAAANAANSIPELRQRIVDDQIVEYDHCDTAHTVALPDGTFVNCQTDCRCSFADFQAHGRQRQAEARGRHGFVQPGDDETQLIFVSSTPWVTFTQVIQPTPMPADSCAHRVRQVLRSEWPEADARQHPVQPRPGGWPSCGAVFPEIPGVGGFGRAGGTLRQRRPGHG